MAGNLIAELPAQIFDKNDELRTLCVPAWAARAPLVEGGSAVPFLPFKRARFRSIANGKAMRVRRGYPLPVCVLWVCVLWLRPKTSC